MRTNIRLVIGLLLCATFPAGCRRGESHPKPIKPVQTQEAPNYFPSGGAGDGERYSASILPSSQNELAFKYGGYLSEIHQVNVTDKKTRSVQDGDSVTKGTVLARLRNDDFAAKVKQAEAQLAEAQSATETN